MRVLSFDGWLELRPTITKCERVKITLGIQNPGGVVGVKIDVWFVLRNQLGKNAASFDDLTEIRVWRANRPAILGPLTIDEKTVNERVIGEKTLRKVWSIYS